MEPCVLVFKGVLTLGTVNNLESITVSQLNPNPMSNICVKYNWSSVMLDQTCIQALHMHVHVSFERDIVQPHRASITFSFLYLK